MSFDIDIDVDTSQVFAKTAAMTARSASFRPTYEWARLELQKSNAENFAAGGLPSGSKWPPREKVYAWPPLRKSGTLFRSLTNLRGPDVQISNDRASFGTDIKYAKFHQYGTRYMAKRQIVFEPFGFAHELAERTAKYVAEGDLL